MFRRAFKFMLYSSALGLGAVIALATFHETVEGSGVPTTEDRPVGPVTQISLSGDGNLTIIQGNTPSLSVTTDDNLLHLIETESSGNRLAIRSRSGYSLRPKGPINFTLTVPHIEKIDVTGSGRVQCEKLTGESPAIRLTGSGNASFRQVACKTLSVTISGSGAASIGGTAEKFKLRISGSGDIDASELRAASADVQVSGSGTAAVWATSDLKVRVSGSGDVKYKGSPKLDQKLRGSGKIHAIGE